MNCCYLHQLLVSIHFIFTNHFGLYISFIEFYFDWYLHFKIIIHLHATWKCCLIFILFQIYFQFKNNFLQSVLKYFFYFTVIVHLNSYLGQNGCFAHHINYYFCMYFTWPYLKIHYRNCVSHINFQFENFCFNHPICKPRWYLIWIFIFCGHWWYIMFILFIVQYRGFLKLFIIFWAI